MARTGGANSQKTMTIMGHIQELQARLILSVIVLLLGASLAYVFRDPIIHSLLSPLQGQSLIYLNPAGGFSFILLISVYIGLAVAAPVIIHQLYCFLRPILPKKIQRYSLTVFLCSLILLLAGVAFGYIFAIPGALNFLYEFAGEYVEASLTAESYLNFVVAYTLGLGLVFQLPLILMLIHWIKPLTPSALLKSERWIIVVAFIVAAIITPTPDPLNQTVIALPVVTVYQFGVAGVSMSIYRERRREKKNRSIQTRRTHSSTTITPPPKQAVRPAPPATQLITSDIPSSSRPSQMIHSSPKSIDGFTTQRRQRPIHTIVPPARQAPQSRIIPERVHTYRPVLSLDGVSRLY